MAQKSGTIWSGAALGYNFGTMYVAVKWASSNGKITFTASPAKYSDGSYHYPKWDANGSIPHSASYLKMIVTDTKGTVRSAMHQWMRGGGAGSYIDAYLSGLSNINTAFLNVKTPAIVGTYIIKIGQCDANGTYYTSGSTPQQVSKHLAVLPEMYTNVNGIKYPIIDIKVNVNGTAVDIVDVQIEST